MSVDPTHMNSLIILSYIFSSGLFVAEECRRETSAAHTLALVSGTTSVMESFAHVSFTP